MAMDGFDELTQMDKQMIASLGEKAAWLERWSWRGWKETLDLKRQVCEVKDLLEVVKGQMDVLEEKLTQGGQSTKRPANKKKEEGSTKPGSKKRPAASDMQQKEGDAKSRKS